MPTILFVCTGNLCRSPMAAALLQARLSRDEARHDWQVGSAGVWTTDGRPASAYAIDEMAQRSIDLRVHRSRNVTRALMDEADLVLAMTQDHAEALTAAFPDQAHKVHLLSEVVGQRYDVSDPYGGSRLEYTYIAKELEGLIEAGYERIVALVESTESKR
jgi:protein-tyrosine phosphatase